MKLVRAKKYKETLTIFKLLNDKNNKTEGGPSDSKTFNIEITNL